MSDTEIDALRAENARLTIALSDVMDHGDLAAVLIARAALTQATSHE
jgi:phosphoenolpyruvate carboxylase